VVTKTFTVDANDIKPTTEFLPLTVEMVISFYVLSKSGDHTNRRIGIEVTPNGVDWIRVGGTIKENGHLSVPCNAVAVKPYVSEAEGKVSSVTVIIIAR